MKRILVAASLLAVTAGTVSAVGARRAPTKPLRITFVDVEGGAATLLVTPAGESVLIDTGWPENNGRDADRIRKAAQASGVDRIDHLLCTHWHIDHYGGVAQLAERMPVGRYYDRGIPEKSVDDPENFPTLIAAYKKASRGQSTHLRPGD